MSGIDREDTHFYIDNVPPGYVLKILQTIRSDVAMTIASIAEALTRDHGVIQKPRSEWPGRLYDLGLAYRETVGNTVAYKLTPLGVKVRDIESVTPSLYPDLVHFLHFSSFDGTPGARKYLWSYRRCSQLAWRSPKLPGTREIAAAIQSQMREEFGYLDYQTKIGARFDSSAAGRWLLWIRQLIPSPFPKDADRLHRRVVSHFQLVLLALDDIYRHRHYRYGDPVILDDALLDEIASVFFLDLACCRQLIDTAARLTKAIKLSDTFAGTSITLLEPYSIERI